ncbi:MAG: arsenate reductase (glutaredoxin) [Flavobacteriales bacterium]|nr:arsenate reductase (glutaredoxin) [Flavobacteriales bacterium]MBL6873210.1 arsenate reductase (glutaredoxin) [Flavobacteriales bacterium]
MEVTIYHNPRCSKSRQALSLLESKGCKTTVVEYLKKPLTVEQLSRIINDLNIKPIDLVRKNESVWKENYKGKELSDGELIDAMISNPKLIERPIVLSSKGAVVGRPLENILNVL